MTGATLGQIAEFLGIDLSTLTRWTHRYPEFADALESGAAIADEIKAA